MWVKGPRETRDLELPRPQVAVGARPIHQASCISRGGHHFGSFQDLPCETLKNVLAELEYHRTGRVRLCRNLDTISAHSKICRAKP